VDARRKGWIAIVVSAVSFGGVAVLGKLALSAGMTVPALLFWRWLVAAVALAPVAWLALEGRGVSRRALLGGFALGAVGYAGTSGVYVSSLPHIAAALASFLLFTSPAIVAALSALLGERLSPRGLAALALALAGLALLAFGPGVAASLVGVALAVLSAFIYAGTIVAGRRIVADEEPLVVATGIMAGAAVAFGVFGAATGSWGLPSDFATWGVVLAMGIVSTALSVGAFYVALPLIGAPRAALASTLEPVSTAAVAFIVLGETLAVPQLAGAALVLAAVALLATERPAAAAPT